MTGSSYPPGAGDQRLDRLRASLRLIFDGDTADSLIRVIPPGEIGEAALARLTLPALVRFTAGRVRGRLSFQSETAEDARPLSPASGAPASGALALALHLGLDLDIATLARLLKTDAARVGVDLVRARQAVAPAIPTPCEDVAAVAGCYRDRSTGPHEHLSFVGHARGCPACGGVLVESRRVDAQLLDRIDAYQASLPALAASGAARALSVWNPAVMVTIAVALAVIVLASGFAAAARILPEEREPVPLLSVRRDPLLSGWLLTLGPGNAVDLLSVGTGQRLSYRPEDDSRWGEPLLSPNGRRLAVAVSPHGLAGWNQLEIHDLLATGSEPVVLEWGRPDTITLPVAWLDDSTLLRVEMPINRPGESHSTAFARRERESRLVAVEIETGEERVLFQGSVMTAQPSPDGSTVALLRQWDSARLPGATLELRPLEGGRLSEPVAVVEHRVVPDGRLFWAPDSSRVYFAMITDDPLPVRGGSGGAGYDPLRVQQVNLAALDREDRISQIVVASGRERILPASVAPDGAAVVGVRLVEDERRGLVGGFWLFPVSGEPAVDLGIEVAGWWYGSFGAFWSSDGRALLLSEMRPYYLGPDETIRTGSRDVTRDIPSYHLVVFDRDGRRLGVAGLYFRPVYGIGWLPAGLEPAAAQPAELTGIFSPPEPVEGLDQRLRLARESAVSVDGRFIILRDASLDLPVIWDRERDSTRRLRSDAVDLSWKQDSDAVIGAQVSVEISPSRISLHAPRFTARDSPYDFSRFDPAGIGNEPWRHYRRPLISPTGKHTVVFVVDERRGSLALWLASTATAPYEVGRWFGPRDARLDVPPVAEWVDDQTLIFSLPGSWEDGYPVEAVLSRLDIDAQGGATVTELTRLGTRGNELGVVLQELDLAPDGSVLAYRLRGFTRLDPDAGRIDTISVAHAEDLTSPIELTRGGIGEGLTWSADSRYLVAVTRGRLAVYTSDGRRIEYLTPAGALASDPLWVAPDDLWFSLDEGAGPRVMRVHALLR